MEYFKLTAALHNLGCKVNAYEADAMLEELRRAGIRIVPWEGAAADIYIINTCSVTNIADRKSRQMIHKARSMNPDAVVIAAGCYVQARAAELQTDTAVDILVGNQEKGRLLPILEAYWAAHPDRRPAGTELIAAILHLDEGAPLIGDLTGPRGYHEVVLTGIHLSSYGLDFDHANYEYAMNHEIPSTHLLALIRAVAAVPGIARVRLGSLEPRIITEPFVEALRAIPELCPHFHLSLQSGSDRILSAMNRHYDTAAFRHSVALLRAAWPEVAITTDVIVGFPGESDADFEDSYRFVEEIGFYELHVFKYSRRQGTVADRMPGQLTDRVKSERSERLMKLDTQQSEAFRCRFLGRTEDVIPEEIVRIEGRPYLRGYNRCYVRYLIPLSDATEGACKIGQIMQVCGQEICGGCVLALGL